MCPALRLGQWIRERRLGQRFCAATDAKSAKDLGGMDKLVEAAKKEGALNVIALPPDWANYKEILDGFAKKYPGITITSDQPDASSADEIATADRLKGQSTAPDVFDLGTAVALANTAKYAPYKVEAWDKIPAENRESTGLWVNDYAGLMTVGYDSAKVPAPMSLDDLLRPDYKGKGALNGDPTKAGAAFAGVQMVSIANGGSAADPTKGIEWFKRLKDAATSCRSTRLRPRSSRERRRSSSTGPTTRPAWDVMVLLRPEGVRVAPAGPDGGNATVVSASFLGGHG